MSLNYLLDTCVISEFVKPKPDKRVQDWLNSLDGSRVYLSVVTLGEIQRGISEKPASNRRTKLEEWLNGELVAQFEEQRQDFSPNRSVQARHRFVGDQQFGLERQRPGDQNPLPLPA